MNHREPHKLFLGKEAVLTGRSAIEIVESAISESAPNLPAGVVRNIFGRPLIAEQDRAGGVAFSMGLCAAGLRVSAALEAKDVLREEEQLIESARRHLAFVVHVFTQNKDRHGRWQDTDHRHVHAVSDTGWIQLFASNVQDAVDLTILGHKITELSLCPVMVVVDDSSSAAEQVVLPDQNILEQFLGRGDDFIECPTPAQKMIFGKSRRRIPNWFHFDFPTAQGTVKTGQAQSFELAAQQAYFGSHVTAIAEAAFKEYAHQTGREQIAVASYGMDDAEYVIVVQGSSYHRTASVADFLRSKKIKAGCLHVRLLRPWPGKELCEHLMNKKCVTVLERVTQPLAHEPPIFRNVVTALDKAAQNGAKKKKAVFPGYPVMSERQRPVMYSGQYGTGHSSLTYSDILQVFENMINDGRRRFFVGIDFARATSAYPKQHILFQNTKRDYPEIDLSSLGVLKPSRIASDQAFALRWCLAGPVQASGEAVEDLCDWLSRRWGVRVRASLRGGDAQATSYQMDLTRRPWPYPIEKDDEADGLITEVSALKTLSCLEGLKKEAPIVFLISPQTESIRLPKFVAERLKEMNCKLYRLPKIAEYEELLFGAALTLASRFFNESADPAKEIGGIERYFREHRSRTLSDTQKKGIEHGLTQMEEIHDASLFQTEDPEPVALPLALRQYEDHGPPYSRISQFYDRSGFFYATGTTEEMAADPFQSVPVLPAATSNFVRAEIAREQLPEFIPSQCTGCGQCAVYCPESAIPPIVISAESLIKSILDNAQAGGVSVSQWTPPIIKNMAKLANQALSLRRDNATTLGEILPDVVTKLVAQMKIEGDRVQLMKDQLDAVMPSLSNFPMALTKTFFSDPEIQTKGSGNLFSVAINPQACTGCSLCARACPENALIMAPSIAERSLKLQSQFQLWEQLPDTPADVILNMVQDQNYDPFAAILLSRNYYMSMAGGLASGNSSFEKIMLHLVAAAAESTIQANSIKWIKDIEQCTGALAEKVRNKLREALPEDDFDGLLASLSGGENPRVPLDAVIAKLGKTQRFGVIETAWMERHVTLIHDLKNLAWTLSKGPAGTGRARFGAVLSTADTFEWAKHYPYNAFTSPVIINDSPDSLDFVLGLCLGHVRQMMDNIKLLRRAELEIQNQYDPFVHDEQLANLTWADLNENEKSFVPPLFVITDARRISDAPPSALLKLLASDYPIKMLVFNDAAGTAEYWRNTMALTTSLLSLRKIFFLQSSLAKPEHMFKGLIEGLRDPGPGFFSLLTPAVSMDDVSGGVAELFQLSVRSRAFPLLRFTASGQKTFLSTALDLSANPEPFEDLVSVEHEQGESGAGCPVKYVLTFADWTFRQPGMKDHFAPWDDQEQRGIAVADYIVLAPEARADKVPFIITAAAKNRLEKYSVSDALVKAAEAASASWSALREMAGMLSPYPQKVKERIDEAWATKHAAALEQAKLAYDEKLRQLENDQLEKIKQKLTDKLLALSGYENNS
jgi:pyruvate-ferredoxin/flavodoxin oxidoreductase